jgi:RNA polymerase sigma factor (TIGR02999 family)
MMAVEDSLPITKLLAQWRNGDNHALERLAPVIYTEMRRQARSLLKKERSGHTFTTSDLVNETFVKMLDERERTFQNRIHFFALSAKVMRDFLIQYARARKTRKRGGDQFRITLETDVQFPGKASEDLIIDMARAIDALRVIDPRKAWIIEMFYYAGLDINEIAEATSSSPATVKRDLRFSRAWIKKYLSGEV